MDTVTLDERLVRALLREQHPDLAGLSLSLVAGGWDNQLWRLGDTLAVRLPLTPRAPALLRKEYRWLPVLAPHLPLPVPTPKWIGEPSERFPKVWTLVTWVPGEPADLASGSRRSPRRTPTFDQQLGDLADDGDAAEARDLWDDAVLAPAWRGPEPRPDRRRPGLGTGPPRWQAVLGARGPQSACPSTGSQLARQPDSLRSLRSLRSVGEPLTVRARQFGAATCTGGTVPE